MRGEVGALIAAASSGNARSHVSQIFGPRFQTINGWMEALQWINGSDVNSLLNKEGDWWRRQSFQALYIACWIHHPVEKGSFMLQLDNRMQLIHVENAFRRLQAERKLTTRISSHLSGKGASAHIGWDFLQGYEELLIQLEMHPSPYLFLKCEGEALTGLSLGTIVHLADWVKKEMTGAGSTFNAHLNSVAERFPMLVEGRAAENYSPTYQTLLKQLGLTGKMVTVADVVEKLSLARGGKPLPLHMKRDTKALAEAMLDDFGYLAKFRTYSHVLKAKKIDFSLAAEAELRNLANRMLETSTTHHAQVYNEIRVTATDLNKSLMTFWSLAKPNR